MTIVLPFFVGFMTQMVLGAVVVSLRSAFLCLWPHKKRYTMFVKDSLLVLSKRWNSILLLALLCYLLDLNLWVTSTTLVLEAIALLVERKSTYGVMEIPQARVVRNNVKDSDTNMYGETGNHW